ncbi:MAG: BolA family transcriptional regulator [Legionellales bacterium]|nr:BolA family transcriptional regulator [Legionellales bacterium]
MTTQQEIYRILDEKLAPQNLIVIDDSEDHIGHAGSADGKGHFTVQITSTKFDNLSRIQCHRVIYDLLDDLMKTKIHALKIVILYSPR